jgi:hypothetical protein
MSWAGLVTILQLELTGLLVHISVAQNDTARKSPSKKKLLLPLLSINTSRGRGGQSRLFVHSFHQGQFLLQKHEEEYLSFVGGFSCVSAAP